MCSEFLTCQLNVSDSHILILRAVATYSYCTLLLHTHLGVYVHARMCMVGPRPVQTTPAASQCHLSAVVTIHTTNVGNDTETALVQECKI